MAKILNVGKGIIRISPKSANRIEFSTNDGRNWVTRHSGSNCGDFIDLVDNGKEILGTTTKGLYFSTNEGRNWVKRQ